jgi:hypothetical protein
MDQPGLRKRLVLEARRISAQHRHLNEIYDALLAALGRGIARETGDALRRFADALRAHFDLEEGTHFPALHGLRPEVEPELTELVLEHRRFRSDLDRLAELFETEQVDALSSGIDALGRATATHEEREERLFPSPEGSAPVPDVPAGGKGPR